MSEPADELGRLLGSAQQWARDNLGPSSGHFAAAQDCQWCPLCQLLALVRGEHPELTDRLVSAGTEFLVSLRALVESLTERTAPDAAPRVQHIDLGGTGE